MVMTNFSVTGHKNIGFVPNRNNLGTEGKFLGFVMLTRMAKVLPCLCLVTTKLQLDRKVFPGRYYTSAGGCGVPPTPK